jgi:hypothetical protein
MEVCGIGVELIRVSFVFAVFLPCLALPCLVFFLFCFYCRFCCLFLVRYLFCQNSRGNENYLMMTSGGDSGAGGDADATADSDDGDNVDACGEIGDGDDDTLLFASASPQSWLPSLLLLTPPAPALPPLPPPPPPLPAQPTVPKNPAVCLLTRYLRVRRKRMRK